VMVCAEEIAAKQNKKEQVHIKRQSLLKCAM